MQTRFRDLGQLDERLLNKMNGSEWVWICKNSDEIIYDVLVVNVPTKQKPIAKLAIKAGIVALNAVLYLKNLQFF